MEETETTAAVGGLGGFDSRFRFFEHEDDPGSIVKGLLVLEKEWRAMCTIIWYKPKEEGLDDRKIYLVDPYNNAIAKLYQLLKLIADAKDCYWLHNSEEAKNATTLGLSSRAVQQRRLSPSLSPQQCIYSSSLGDDECLEISFESFNDMNELKQSRWFVMDKVYYIFWVSVVWIINIENWIKEQKPSMEGFDLEFHLLNDAVQYCYYLIHQTTVRRRSSGSKGKEEEGGQEGGNSRFTR